MSVFVGEGVHASTLDLSTSLKLGDNDVAYFGEVGTGIAISHIGTAGLIQQNTGILEIKTGTSNGSGVQFKTGDDKITAKFQKDLTGKGNFELLYEGSTRILGESWGTEILNGELRVKDNDIVAYSSSDERLKDNISPIKQALDKVNSISGNTFNWNAASDYEGKGDTGVIAQEIEALDLPGVTTTRDSGYKAVRYEKLVPLLIEAIKELSAKVDNLEAMAHPKPTGKTQQKNEDRLDALENKINN